MQPRCIDLDQEQLRLAQTACEVVDSVWRPVWPPPRNEEWAAPPSERVPWTVLRTLDTDRPA